MSDFEKAIRHYTTKYGPVQIVNGEVYVEEGDCLPIKVFTDAYCPRAIFKLINSPGKEGRGTFVIEDPNFPTGIKYLGEVVEVQVLDSIHKIGRLPQSPESTVRIWYENDPGYEGAAKDAQYCSRLPSNIWLEGPEYTLSVGEHSATYWAHSSAQKSCSAPFIKSFRQPLLLRSYAVTSPKVDLSWFEFNVYKKL